MAGTFLYLKYIRTSFLLLLRVGPGSYQLRLIYLVSRASGSLCYLMTLLQPMFSQQEADPQWRKGWGRQKACPMPFLVTCLYELVFVGKMFYIMDLSIPGAEMVSLLFERTSSIFGLYWYTGYLLSFCLLNNTHLFSQQQSKVDTEVSR